MVGATISFLTPLSGSPAVASVLGEARKLQSIVGTSDIEAETPQVPEIKQVEVKASNTETTNMEQKLNSGGFVSGPSGIDKVPARLTAGEFVMSKGAVKKFGASTLASMNAAGGGTNKPTLMGRYNEGGAVADRPGILTDKEEIARIKAETLHWVNKERVEFLGLPPLKEITLADGVELTKPMGKEFYGAGITEESSEDMNFDTMTKTTTRWKQRGSEIIFEGASERLTEEDKQAYLDSNPVARMALELKDQLELDILGADISESAKMNMNGGGLVPAFNGGGLVPSAISPATQSSNIKPNPKKNREQLNNTPINITKRVKVKASIVPIQVPTPVVITKQVFVEKPVLKNRALLISDQGKGVLVS